MKSFSSLWMICLGLVVALSSCEEIKTEHDYLIESSWKFSEVSSDEWDQASMNIIDQLLSGHEISFHADGTFTEIYLSNTQSGTWEFNQDFTALIMDTESFGELTRPIQTLEEGVLIFEELDQVQGTAFFRYEPIE
ncbi:hypothetical protein [Pontibacter sp. G13]|uniref:hypothetical protein n=1 Tax=Pontibacter sp. G13 TaxID=3074898 RepID=UPI00288AC27F|nr:hypothetical protein [Pontibacter sp. G13]WNJ16173.1 hypothetical protein RJD25_15020 [Pontibacter sp. G13]